jgi:hypothetical protein
MIYVPLFIAMRDGDDVGPGCVPRGKKSSTGAKHQVQRAKILHRQRRKYYTSIGRPGDAPTLDQCFPSRNLRFHYKQVLRFCLAVNTLDKRSISAAEIGFAQSLLETLCIDYTRMNIPLSPNFHYMMHLEESMLKSGSLYNTNVWPMERANGVVSHINNNDRGQGVMEGTVMRGWWGYTTLQNLVCQMLCPGYSTNMCCGVLYHRFIHTVVYATVHQRMSL